MWQCVCVRVYVCVERCAGLQCVLCGEVYWTGVQHTSPHRTHTKRYAATSPH
jgi:uncharacterized protein with PIN domain